MGVVIKQSFWGTIVSYIGVIVSYFTTLYIRPKYFELEQIGLFALITSNAMMLSPLCSLGFSGTYIKFFPMFKTEKERHALFTFHLLIALFIGVIILFIGYFLKPYIANYFIESSPEYIKLLTVTGFVMLANSFFALLTNYSNSILKVVLPSILQEVYLKVGSMLLVIGYGMGWFDFQTAANGLGVVYTLSWMILLAYQVFVHKLRFNFNFDFIQVPFLKNIGNFAFYSLLMAVSFGVFNNFSNSQISSMLGADFTGIYSTCFFIGVIVEMPRRNATKVITPILSKALVNNDLTQVKSIFKRSSIGMTCLGVLLMIGITTNIADLLSFVPKGEKLALGINVVICVAVAKTILMVSSFPGEMITFTKYYYANVVFQILLAVNLLILNYFLIPNYGITGVGISYVITISIDVTLRLVFIYYHYKIHPFTSKHFKLFIISLAVLVGAYYFDFGNHPILKIGFRSIITFLVFTFLIFKFKISDDINRIIEKGLAYFSN